jgi:DNA excision repair protein ERCC-4
MIILKDSREKKPWEFQNFDECEAEVCVTLKTGDYTIEGYEDKIIIDRKGCVAELANNLGKDYKRFRNELKRMEDFEEAYIVCDFPIMDVLQFPKSSGISAKLMKYVKMTGEAMFKQINTIEGKYNVKFIFCNNREEAQEKAIELFLDVINKTTK